MLRLRQGTWYRERYDPNAFTFPPKDLRIMASYAGSDFEEILVDRDGPFVGRYRLVERFERDGRRWARFVENLFERACDVEIRPDGTFGEVRALPPEKAWELALALDATRGFPVVTEDG